jgi:hypothetical protein
MNTPSKGNVYRVVTWMRIPPFEPRNCRDSSLPLRMIAPVGFASE